MKSKKDNVKIGEGGRLSKEIVKIKDESKNKRDSVKKDMKSNLRGKNEKKSNKKSINR